MGTMNDDYGMKMGRVFDALIQLHGDTRKLLQECDTLIGKGRPSVWGNLVFADGSWVVYADHWMVEAVFRYWEAADELPGLVEGMTVCFGDFKRRIAEPILLLGQLKYAGDRAKWDLWDAFFDWGQGTPLGNVAGLQGITGDRIEWLKIVAIPLYSIRSVDDVMAWMERVRKTTITAPTEAGK